MSGREQWWIKGDRGRGTKEQTASAANTMITLPSNFSLPLLHAMLSSKAQGEMWLKLEFPFAGEAEKQESQGRG